MSRRDTAPFTTRKTLGQVVVCLGCCCGRTDKGHPAVPVDWLKAEWKRRTLPKKIHLTISGCLGPCDATNVVMILFGAQAIFLGGLSEQSQYLALVEWASACERRGELVPLPPALEKFRMQRFAGEESSAAVA